MRSLMLLVIALPAFAGDIVRVDVTPMADANVIDVGGVAIFKLNSAATGVTWEADGIPEIGKNGKGEPVIVYGEVAVKDVLKAQALTTFRGGEFQDTEVQTGWVIVGGKTQGKVRLVARGVVDGIARRVETLTLTIGPRPPPPPILQPGEPGQLPSKGLAFWVVRPDGPVQPAHFAMLSLPGWEVLAKAGHKRYDVTLSEANRLGAKITDTPPLVLTLQETQDGKSRVYAPAVKAPTDNAGVLKLGEILKP